jgi:GNAT superfamily N-acetyltransferase
MQPDDLVISVETKPAARDIEALGTGLREHALPFTAVEGFHPLGVFARSSAGKLVGGAYGLVNWTWLQISLLWVCAELRNQGLGSRLLNAIEAAGKQRGCRHAHLDTFSYQARPFYERHGYTLFATLDQYPPGHRRYFLQKSL